MEGYLEHIVPHEMWCSMYGPYPQHSGNPCNCPVKIVRELEAENRRLQSELKKAQEANIFAAAFADKVQEFGTIPRLIEAYSASKMECRRLEQELQAANLAHEQYREWAAEQVRQAKAALREAEYLLRDSEHLDARIERYFEAKKKP